MTEYKKRILDLLLPYDLVILGTILSLVLSAWLWEPILLRTEPRSERTVKLIVAGSVGVTYTLIILVMFGLWIVYG